MDSSHRCRPWPDSGTSQAAVDQSCRYDEVCEQIAQVMGALNVGFGQLLEITSIAIAEGHAQGSGIRSTSHWLQWRTGLAAQQCTNLVRLAKRAEELPVTVQALVDGELTLDQAAVIARMVPAGFDRGACEFAKVATVRQLRSCLAQYGWDQPEGDDDPNPTPEPEVVSRGEDRHGRRHLDIRLHPDHGAVADAALEAAREDLYQQRRAETPEGEKVEPVTLADAHLAMAEHYLASRKAEHPGSDRHLVHLHLQAGADGPVLADHLGFALPDTVRRLILCDCLIRATWWKGRQPVDVGRLSRTIPNRLRRLIEHRDGGCAVPGCHATRGLQIHHIHHWEDGGPTDADNLLTLCPHHHRLHHQGLLGIARTPSVEHGEIGWITYTDRWNRPLDALGQPVVTHRPARRHDPHRHERDPEWDPHREPVRADTPAGDAHAAAATAGLSPGRYECPTGERLQMDAVTFNPD